MRSLSYTPRVGFVRSFSYTPRAGLVRSSFYAPDTRFSEEFGLDY